MQHEKKTANLNGNRNKKGAENFLKISLKL